MAKKESQYARAKANLVVELSVHNGVVDVDELPPGITVVIRDYDCPEDYGDDSPNVMEDEHGDRYMELRFEADR